MAQSHDISRSVLRSAPADEGAGAGGRAGAGRDAASLALRETGAMPGSGPGEFRIARDGTWFHEGEPIRRRGLVKLFATVLRREDDGGYALVTPVERAPVHVEDAPFVAEELEARREQGRQVLALRTNLDQWVEADSAHPIRVTETPGTGAPNPYILVTPGLEARLARSVFYQLADLAERGRPQGAPEGGPEGLGVWSRGMFFPLDPTGAV